MTPSPWMSWLDEAIGSWRSGRRCLVLCRNRSTLALVRRWAARKGGLLGLEAATPAGLAMQVLQSPVLAGRPTRAPVDEVLPSDSEMGRLIGGRPGLSRSARRWVQHLRALRRVDATHSAPERVHPADTPRVQLVDRPPAWLVELAATSFGADEEERALHAFLDAVQARGRTLSGSASWDRVVAIGFDRPAAGLAPWEPWLVERLTGVAPCVPNDGATAPIPAWRVPDVSAEARVAVQLALQDPDGTLILVHDTTTARRVRDALMRNGIGCTYKDSESLAVHELASAVRRCVAWFTDPPDPAIPLADLAFVLSRTALGRPLHPAAEEAARVLAGTTEAERPTRAGLIAALESTRLLDGPLSLWQQRIRERLADTKAAGEPADTLAGVAVRLALLAAALGSRPVEDVLGELTGRPLHFDADDFDDVVATLLGDQPQAACPPGNRLGAIQRFLLSCRVRLHDDPVARAIVGALRDRSDWPATPAHVHHALAGSVDLGILCDGVDLILVEDYDERPCRQLVVLDVHDHGLARGVTPDPLLDDDEMAALRVLAGRHVVEERLRLVRRATARAGRVIALVTERDPNGREVVPPIQLDLSFGAGPEVGSYGLTHGGGFAGLHGGGLPPLPECAPPPIRPRTTLDHEGELPPPHAPDPAVRWLATQATAEWFREGRAMGQGFRAAEPATLAEIRRTERAPPAFVRPYLGYLGPAPEGALPVEPHSVSRLLLPLARCGYLAFGKQILKIREPTPIADGLDPRELGTVVHRALERVGTGLRRAEEENEQVALVARLRTATHAAFEQAIADLGTLSEARRVAVDGHRERWNVHWHRYVRSRAKLPQSPGFPKAIEEHPAVHAWIAQLRRRVPALSAVSDERIRGWVLWSSKDTPHELADSAPPVVVREGERDALPLSAAADLAEILRSAEWLDLHRTVLDALDRLEIWKLAPYASAAEVSFGDGPREEDASELSLGPVALKLGQGELSLRGRIDRVDFVVTERGDRYAGVTDYKTGTAQAGWQFRRDQRSLRDPQLLVYAMVLEKAAVEGRLPDALRGVRSAVVAHDRVRHVVDDADAATQDEARAVDTWMPIDRKWLGWAARELGTLVDDARLGQWPLRPRADSCPLLVSYGGESCALAGACRFRALPPDAPRAPARTDSR